MNNEYGDSRDGARGGPRAPGTPGPSAGDVRAILANGITKLKQLMKMPVLSPVWRLQQEEKENMGSDFSTEASAWGPSPRPRSAAWPLPQRPRPICSCRSALGQQLFHIYI